MRQSLPCFSQFRLRGSLQPCSVKVNHEAVEIFTSLTSDVQRLEGSLAQNPMSIRWCKEAVVVLRKMHSEFVLIFEKFKVPISWDGVDVLLDEYMKKTLNILDLCNLLKSVIYGLDRYRLAVDFAAKNLHERGFVAAKRLAEIERLQEDGRKLHGVEKWKDVNLYKPSIPKTWCKESVTQVLYAIKSAMDVISLLIFSAILCPVPVKFDKEAFCGFSNELKPLLGSIEKLVECFEIKFQKVRDGLWLALDEQRMVEEAIVNIQAQVTKDIDADRDEFKRSIESLKQKSMALEKGLEMLGSAMTQVFDEIVKGRSKVLRMIATGTAN